MNDKLHITDGMMHEMWAHMPWAVRQAEMSTQWNWQANYLNFSIQHPGAVCACCFVDRSGNVMEDMVKSGMYKGRLVHPITNNFIDPEDEPEYSDGHDWEGFPGGCARLGHDPAKCPARRHRLPERDEGLPAEEQGLFRKFHVQRVDGQDAPGGKHANCRYFVIDVDHDPYARAVLLRYADACRHTHPLLADDLRNNWLGGYKGGDREPQFPTMDTMVGRFLAWELPRNLNPDGGLLLDKTYISRWPELWPTGTNLLDAEQAEAMIRVLIAPVEDDPCPF